MATTATRVAQDEVETQHQALEAMRREMAKALRIENARLDERAKAAEGRVRELKEQVDTPALPAMESEREGR